MSLADLDGFVGQPEIPRVLDLSTSAVVIPAPIGISNDARQQTTLVGRSWTPMVFYFKNETAQAANFSLTLEGTAGVAFRKIEFRHAADALSRRFEHGVVLGNPSPRPYTFNLNTLYPGRKFKRLSATSCQDLTVNNGAPVGAAVTLAARDGLFLIDVTP